MGKMTLEEYNNLRPVVEKDIENIISTVFNEKKDIYNEYRKNKKS